MIFKKILTFSFLFCSCLSAHTLFLSIQRSGSHFFINGLGYLTLEPFTTQELFLEGKTADMSLEFRNPLHLKYNQEAPPILIRSHLTAFINSFNKHENKLIFILRNPIESLLASKEMRHNKNLNSISRREIEDYFKYIQCFDMWPQENRLLIYYEDLIRDPIEVFARTLEFLGKSDERLELLTYDLERLKEESKRTYANHFKKLPPCSNDQPDYHIYRLDNPEAVKQQVSHYLYQLSPKIYDTYLKRYFLPASQDLE